MAKQPRDMDASVRARLLALAREKGQALDPLLTRYATERLLYRLSTTRPRDRFVLKGAMLITTWFDDPHRPTRDVDLLGYGDPAPPMLAVFKEICAIKENNGILFDVDALRIDLIREQLENGGLRLCTTVRLASARITVVINIGFGDAIEPGVQEINPPVLLDLPVPGLRAYARETVVAEKKSSNGHGRSRQHPHEGLLSVNVISQAGGAWLEVRASASPKFSDKRASIPLACRELPAR